MQTALLINGSKKFCNDSTRLNHTLQEIAKEELLKRGYGVLETFIERGYNIDEEIQKISKSSLIIYQMPAWWMGEPWIVKKYIDKVFSLGGAGVLYKNDGRSNTNPNKNYGKGGLANDKKVMLSVTWNAPYSAFVEENDFFEAKGVDMVYFHLRKLHEFCGMTFLPIFMCNDVVKNPQIRTFMSNYKAHLAKVLD
ncbi:NAD(P)H-dependent oxidoreductase [Campylobacter sp. LR291e]|uniref:NAD(P)H-dependent oxidoreductase n=1 Tax=unclassified Campylobacter TaxID=2593542 RepID=UPI001237D868|nr:MULTISPECIES: NAD(P)H-dependent oxidoreductase [unclassified Campylobacter]KAA6226500.1 NAD(P)H-dependent oxidoreductase [Campylobacter sp. LR185c]KAA6233979.1 NAD(P)H-dependent oxidoreductase [Campylobacter sp. LR291e]KAA8603444.1 NADPH quinone reductase MdaB [Campylobacter sp. LR185c]